MRAASEDSEDTLGSSVQSGVRPMTETIPPERAAEAYERLMRGGVRRSAWSLPLGIDEQQKTAIECMCPRGAAARELR